MEIKIEKPNKVIDSLDFAEKTGASFFCLEGNFYIGNVNSLDEANDLIENYTYILPTPPTVAEKLASVGLSVADLKTALGL